MAGRADYNRRNNKMQVPLPILDTTVPFTVTDAVLTRCMTIRIFVPAARGSAKTVGAISSVYSGRIENPRFRRTLEPLQTQLQFHWTRRPACESPSTRIAWTCDLPSNIGGHCLHKHLEAPCMSLQATCQERPVLMILELAEHNLRKDTAGSSLQESLESSKGIQV